MEHMSRDVGGERDVDPDPSGKRGLIDPTPRRIPPPSDAR